MRKTQSDEFVEESGVETYTKSREKVVEIDFDIVGILNELGNLSHLFFEEHLRRVRVALHVREEHE